MRTTTHTDRDVTNKYNYTLPLKYQFFSNESKETYNFTFGLVLFSLLILHLFFCICLSEIIIKTTKKIYFCHLFFMNQMWLAGCAMCDVRENLFKFMQTQISYVNRILCDMHVLMFPIEGESMESTWTDLTDTHHVWWHRHVKRRNDVEKETLNGR